MKEVELLKKLLLNNNLSKSEVNVVFYCYKKERTSKDIATYLSWQAPNVARLLLSMFNKGLLNRRQIEGEKTYLYITNLSSELLDIKKIVD